MTFSLFTRDYYFRRFVQAIHNFIHIYIYIYIYIYICRVGVKIRVRFKGVKRIPIGARRDRHAIEIFTSANMTMMELDK